MTPFLRGAQGGCGEGRMSSPRLGRAEIDYPLPDPQPAPTSCAYWPDEGCQGLNASITGTQGREKLAGPPCSLVASRLEGCSLGTQVPLSWLLQPQKTQDEGDTGQTWRGLWVSSLAPRAHAPLWVPVPFESAAMSNMYQMLTSCQGLC